MKPVPKKIDWLLIKILAFVAACLTVFYVYIQYFKG
jgi:hypothetical protein